MKKKKLKVFKNVSTERFDDQQKNDLEIADTYVQHHGMPKTRREFLASGLKASAAYIMAPSVLNVALSSMAEAAGCASATGPVLPAAVVVDGVNGFSVAGNFVFMNKGDIPLASYNRMGLGSTGSFNVDQTFGATGGNFATISGILAGIQANATPATLANVACLGIATRSGDDSANNELDISGMLSEVLAGDFLPVVGRNRNQPANVPKPAPLQVSGHDDVEAAVSVKGSITNMSAGAKNSLFSAITRLNSSQARKLSSVSGGDALGQLAKESSTTNLELVSGSGGSTSINPLDDAAFSNVYGINNNNINNGIGGEASAVYNALKGNATMCNITVGGCDYHGNGRVNQDAKDNQIGTKIGRVLESARILNRPTFVMLTTAGSTGHALSNVPGAPPTSDDGTKSGIICFFYHPTKKPDQRARQLGHFTDNQGAETSTAVGGSPMKGVTAAVVNYLTFAGRPDLISKITRNTFSTADLEKIKVVFG